MSLFSLELDHWYALEMVNQFSDTSGSHTPIFVEKIIPRKTGKGLLGMRFFSPQGERVHEWRVLQRTPNYLLAANGEDNAVVVRPISFEWLEHHCPELITANPLPPHTHQQIEVQFYLDRIFGRHVGHRVFANFRGDRLVFRCREPQRAEAVDLPVTVTAESFLALVPQVKQYVKYYFADNPDLAEQVEFRLEFDESQILTECALRFDGYKYIEQVWQNRHEVFQAWFDEDVIPLEPNDQMAMFFRLQRYLSKWGGETEPPNGKAWRIFRTLFLRVVNIPVPLEFQFGDIYLNWLYNYEPCRRQCIDIVKQVHETIDYDNNAPPLISPPDQESHNNGGHNMNEETVPAVSPEQLDAVLRFLPIFTQPNYTFGEWVQKEGQFPYFSMNRDALAFLEVLHKQGLLYPFDWMNWQAEAQRLMAEPDALAKADLLALRKLLVTHVRADRFTEGHLVSVLENGHITAILNRLKIIRAAME